jgi:hypothetical protein
MGGPIEGKKYSEKKQKSIRLGHQFDIGGLGPVLSIDHMVKEHPHRFPQDKKWEKDKTRMRKINDMLEGE